LSVNSLAAELTAKFTVKVRHSDRVRVKIRVRVVSFRLIYIQLYSTERKLTASIQKKIQKIQKKQLN